MSKIKNKHEHEMLEHRNENEKLVNKIHQYEDRFKTFSNQLYSLNERHLGLMKENEIMKSKLRTLEHSAAMSNGRPSGIPMKLHRGKQTRNFFFETVRQLCFLFL